VPTIPLLNAQFIRQLISDIIPDVIGYGLKFICDFRGNVVKDIAEETSLGWRRGAGGSCCGRAEEILAKGGGLEL
jgi:hypothetical protein